MKIGSGLTRHKLLTIVIGLYLGKLLLPIVFNNLPSPFHSYTFYAVLTVATFWLFYPFSFIKRELSWFYVFMVIQLLLRLTIWADRSLESEYSVIALFQKNVGLFIAMLAFWHYVHLERQDTLWRLCRYALILSFASIIVNYFVYVIYPHAFSVMVRGSVTEDFATQLSKLGFVGYGFFNGISSYSPAMIYGARNQLLNKTQRMAWVVLFVAMFVMLPLTGVAAFVLFVLLFAGSAWFLRQNYKWDLYRLAAILIIGLLLPRVFVASALYKSADIINVPDISERFVDAGRTIENPDIDRGSREHTGRRLGRIPLLLESFASSPFIGTNYTTEHVAWLDMLSLYGIIGFFPWFMLVFVNTKRTIKVLPLSFVPYYILGAAGFITMGFLKNTGGSHVWTFWVLILPGTAHCVKKLRTIEYVT